MIGQGKLPKEFYQFLVHYYRGEIYRETVWRNRMDVTTNWSIVVSAAMISFVFSNENIPHVVVIINYLLVWFFLYMESRRFRYYTMLKYRTRLLEEEVLSPLFSGRSEDISIRNPALIELADNLKTHQIPITKIEAMAWRLRRNYIILLPILFLVWLTKLAPASLHKATIFDLIERSSVFFIPGVLVFTLMVFSLSLACGIAFWLPKYSKADDLP